MKNRWKFIFFAFVFCTMAVLWPECSDSQAVKQKTETAVKAKSKVKASGKTKSKAKKSVKTKSKEKASEKTKGKARSKEKVSGKTKSKSKSNEKTKAKEKASGKTKTKEKASGKTKTKGKASEKTKTKTKEKASEKTKTKSKEKASEKTKTKTKEKASEKAKTKTKEKTSEKTKTKTKEKTSEKTKTKTKEKAPEKTKTKSSGKAKTKEKTSEKTKAKEKTKSKTKDKGTEKAKSDTKTKKKPSAKKNTTTKPKETEKPKATAKPKATEKPKATAKPKATEKPKVTAKPKTTETPKATAKPKATDKLKSTTKPAVSEKPATGISEKTESGPTAEPAPKTEEKLKSKTMKRIRRNYAVTPKSKVCNKKYLKEETYNKKTKQYYMLKSYIERIRFLGGGKLILKKGTYKIPCTLYLPSNIKIECRDGVRLVKTNKTGTKKLKASDYLFQTISSTKAAKRRKTGRYNASRNVVISGTGKAVINLGYVPNAVAVYVGHARDITLRNIRFRNKKGGSYVWIEGSRNVTISKCLFYKGKPVKGLANQMAVRMETVNKEIDSFRDTWGKRDNTVNRGITISDNYFYDQETAVGTVKYAAPVKSGKTYVKYQTGIKITGNVFQNPVVAVRAMCWTAPEIMRNTMKNTSTVTKIGEYIRGYGVTNPVVTGNTFNGCLYTMRFWTAENEGKGNAFYEVDNVLDDSCVAKWNENILADLAHYYVTEDDQRIFYYRNKTDRNFTITPSSIPYREKYTDHERYAEKKNYFVFRSYMEQLEYAGGGTITVAAGEYNLSNMVCIPSNVTLKLKDGVAIRKVGATTADVDLSKSMFCIVPPSKNGTSNTIRGYNGSQNVNIIGEGKAILDCSNALNVISLVMGHARNITVSGITFLNQNGSHFIELNSSYNVTVKNCVFQGFRPYEGKSHKECINVDGTDANTNGFNYDWSTHDKTTCRLIRIQNNKFINVGTAVGSHTYSASGKNQLYHENVSITGNTVDGTYNSAVRALNWRKSEIKNNVFKNIQKLSDGRNVKYAAISLRGVDNATVTENTFDTMSYYPIRVSLAASPSVSSAIVAGYPDTVTKLTEENWAAMKKNTLKNIAKEFQYIQYKKGTDESNAQTEKIGF